MILRKSMAKCKKCKSIIPDMPVQFVNHHIQITESFYTLGRDTTFRFDIVWKCPSCGHTNSDFEEMFLRDDDYINLIAGRYEKEFRKGEVNFD